MNLQFLVNIFPSKVRVSFRHAITGDLLGVHKIEPEKLPEIFNKPTIIEWGKINWRVLNAEPIYAKKFTITNKLTLYVLENDFIDTRKMGHNLPTVVEKLPELTAQPSFDNNTMTLSSDQWGQLEYLPVSLLPTVQEEVSLIETILNPPQKVNTLTGYATQHKRKIINTLPLNIPVNEFCELMRINQKGSIKLKSEYIKNGMAFYSDSSVYYGLVKENMIEQLYQYEFECADEQFSNLVSAYNILLVDWRNARIITI